MKWHLIFVINGVSMMNPNAVFLERIITAETAQSALATAKEMETGGLRCCVCTEY